MVRSMRLGGLLIAVLVFAAACSVPTWEDGPQGLRAGEAMCEFRVGSNPDGTGIAASADFGALGDGDWESTENCPDVGPCYWRVTASVETGVLTVEVEQPSEGTQTSSWRLDDIPPGGVALEGPWGGPYPDTGTDMPPDVLYRMTCWSGNNR